MSVYPRIISNRVGENQRGIEFIVEIGPEKSLRFVLNDEDGSADQWMQGILDRIRYYPSDITALDDYSFLLPKRGSVKCQNKL